MMRTIKIRTISKVTRKEWYLLGGLARTGSFRKFRSGKWNYFITQDTIVTA